MNDVTIRLFDPDNDFPAVQRVWNEVGWIDSVEDAGLFDFFSVGRVLVAQLGADVECSVHTLPGAMRYETTDLGLCVVSAVTTSRVARRLGLAQRLTARQLAHGAEEGAAVAALGMFDQGFYDKVGFAAGPYDNFFCIDPSTLTVNVPYRAPVRLQKEDYEAVHHALVRRKRMHGGCVIYPPMVMKAELQWIENGFGLGYRGDPDAPVDELTHFVWLEPKGERGPYTVCHMAYQSIDQLLELLHVIKTLGDQVYSVNLTEPPELQLQSLLERPMRHRQTTQESKHANKQRSMSWCQYRILDVAQCVAARVWPGPTIEFYADLDDPVTQVLDRDRAEATWRGCGGVYHIRLGTQSSATAVAAAGDDLPVLKASINAFTRLWFGVCPATGLVATDGMTLPAQLADQLDNALRLPAPRTGWDF